MGTKEQFSSRFSYYIDTVVKVYTLLRSAEMRRLLLIVVWYISVEFDYCFLSGGAGYRCFSLCMDHPNSFEYPRCTFENRIEMPAPQRRSGSAEYRLYTLYPYSGAHGTTRVFQKTMEESSFQ